MLLGAGVRELAVRLAQKETTTDLRGPTSEAGKKLIQADRQLREATTLQARIRLDEDRTDGKVRRKEQSVVNVRLARPNLYRISKFVDNKPHFDEACDGWFRWYTSYREAPEFSVLMVAAFTPAPGSLFPLNGFWPPQERVIFEHSPLVTLRKHPRLKNLRVRRDGAVCWEYPRDPKDGTRSRSERWTASRDKNGNWKTVRCEWEGLGDWAREPGHGTRVWTVESLVLSEPLPRESFAYTPPPGATLDPYYEQKTKWALPLSGFPGALRGLGVPL